MHKQRITGAVAAFALLLATAAQATGTPNSPAGPVVNLIGAGILPAVASDAVGGYAVASQAVDAKSQGVFLSAFDTSGQVIVSQTPVNIVTAGDQVNPAATMTPTGTTIVAFEGPSGANGGLYFRRFAIDSSTSTASFSALDAGEVLVSGALVKTDFAPAIASDQFGDFVVVWAAARTATVNNAQIVAQVFDASGAPIGAPIVVNATSSNKSRVAAAMSPNGDFVVAWEDIDGNNLGVYQRRYAANGVALDAVRSRVNTRTVGLQGRPSVAKFVGGGYVIAFQGRGSSNSGIFKRAFTAAGVAIDAADVSVNNLTTYAQTNPKVSADALGGSLIVFESRRKAGGLDTYVRRFDISGLALGAQYQINTSLSGNQSAPSVALNAQGDGQVVYQNGATGGIDARPLAGVENVDLALTADAVPATPEAVDGSFRYRLRVTNNHAVVAPTGIAAIDRAIGIGYGMQLDGTLPANVSFSQFLIPNVAWQCSNTAGVIACDFKGTRFLAPGATTSVNLVVTADAAGAAVFTPALLATPYDASSANNAASANATLAILPGALSIVAPNYSSGAADTAKVRVRRGSGVTGTVTVDFATSDGSAVAGVDYATTSGTLTWTAGDRADKFATIPVTHVTHPGATRTFTLTISNPTGGATLGARSSARVFVPD